MKKTDIISGNKIISEFMGIDYQPDKPRKFIAGKWRYNKVHYHSSWDALMPVVEKYNSLQDAGLNIVLGQAGFSHDIEQGLLNVDINHLYKAIIKFIKWYNKWKEE